MNSVMNDNENLVQPSWDPERTDCFLWIKPRMMQLLQPMINLNWNNAFIIILYPS